MKHLAVFDKLSCEKVLTGQKTVDGRFSLRAIKPFGCISRGDMLLLKPSGTDIAGEAVVDNVLYFSDLDPEQISKIRANWGKYMCMDEGFWSAKLSSKYATLIFLSDPRRYLVPIKFSKSDRRPWVVL